MLCFVFTSEGPEWNPCATVRCGFYSKCKVVDGNVACVCDKGCTREYKPKCGSDGVTYSNPCQLRTASCEQMKEITVVNDGKCESELLLNKIQIISLNKTEQIVILTMFFNVID